MSSVRLIAAWPLPVVAKASDPRRRRAFAVGAGLLLAAGVAGLLATGIVRLPQASAPSAELAAARARAVALASSRAASAAAPARLRPVTLSRVADASRAGALFATHSWYVPPPPPPPAPPVAPPPPTAPPFPYVFLGSFTPEGEPPVFFLSRADRVIDARVGDRLDGVYEFQSAEGGQLLFNYLPLNIQQSLPGGVAP